MKRWSLFFFLIGCGFYLEAQKLSIQINHDTIRIGEPIAMRWSLTFPVDSFKLISQPALLDTNPWIKSIFAWKVEQVKQDKFIEYSQNLVISAYDSGRFLIPLRGAVLLKGKDTIRLQPDSTFIFATYVPIDTTKPFKDIKELNIQPPSAAKKKTFAWWGLILLALLMGALVVLYFAYKKKRKLANEDAVSKLLPWERAIRQLNEMKEKSVWLRMEPKQFYILLTGVLRRYFEEEFHIDAEEMITAEILEALKKINIDASLIYSMQDLFYTADMAKFAKAKPDFSLMEYHVHLAIDFVEKTRKKEEEVSHDVDKRS
jgi:hypothetical protein